MAISSSALRLVASSAAARSSRSVPQLHRTVATAVGANAASAAGDNDSTTSSQLLLRLSALAVAAATTATVAYNGGDIMGKKNKADCMTIAAVVGKDDFDARYVCRLAFCSIRHIDLISSQTWTLTNQLSALAHLIRFHYVLFAIFVVILETISWMDWNKSKPGVMMVQELQRWHLRGVTWYVSVSTKSTCNMSQQL
jgi:hypothetical protein